MCQPACKPGSVWPCPVALTGRGDHSSGTSVAGRLARPTRTAGPETDPDDPPFGSPPNAVPIRSCSRWGLPCRRRCRRARWALTPPFHPSRDTRGGLLSVALSLGLAGEPVSPAGACPASCFHGARTFLRPPPFGIWQTAAARPAGAPDLGAWDRQVKQP